MVGKRVDELAVSPSVKGPKCRGTCGGKRSNTDSPAVLVKIPTGKIPMCSCCELPLVADVAQGAPAINPRMIEGKHKRFVCTQCRYNVVLLGELRSA